ncbi:MAG: hypothetical protein M3255_09415 [Pseudomonadota bacterium]|nr:hypothetical protein [Pseudomonadota bacterium]
MTDRKTYMREYMRRRRASSAKSPDINSAYIQFTEHLREVIRQEIEQAIQPLLVQLTKLTVNSVSNGIPPALEHTAPPAQVPAKLGTSLPQVSGSDKLPPERVAALRRRAKTCGLSWKEIAQRFNTENIPTPSGTGQWDGSIVAKLVKGE